VVLATDFVVQSGDGNDGQQVQGQRTAFIKRDLEPIREDWT
jgi:hypothetical protein